ncbi:hypothetical protein [Pseudomonas graminis]|uniref:hypothetical protein n=1 Tax=Pseudomonas graminis TaxID=158627 RepID=UPI001414F44C|nr:hypothetical protein [Pseudomonas graminis]
MLLLQHPRGGCSAPCFYQPDDDAEVGLEISTENRFVVGNAVSEQSHVVQIFKYLLAVLCGRIGGLQVGKNLGKARVPYSIVMSASKHFLPEYEFQFGDNLARSVALRLKALQVCQRVIAGSCAPREAALEA